MHCGAVTVAGVLGETTYTIIKTSYEGTQEAVSPDPWWSIRRAGFIVSTVQMKPSPHRVHRKYVTSLTTRRMKLPLIKWLAKSPIQKQAMKKSPVPFLRL